MKALERLVESVILGSRWILVVFLGGLAVALAGYAVSFCAKLFKVMSHVLDYDEAQMILGMLGLIDAALVASLLVMVMIASYENFVGRFDEHEAELSWLGKLDSGSLKIKVASSIVAISSIHLLQVFLNVDSYTDSQIMWLTIMHLTFVASALLLGFLEKIMTALKH
ncbi:TIGR00645 family protein [Oryzibacter oryziterrae]|uniref:TIGR00645 family protein n=1 Tax=Oryzibacter oryziterrae TaxID=2766474 RepID=UPI001F217C2E|nr:TIGR00645 family protein [Oryzibacter oryziterrae]